MRPPTGALLLASCGAAKSTSPAPARELYVGGYARASLAACESLASAAGSQVRIVSAEHGLVRPDALLAPYERRVSGVTRLPSTGELRRTGDVIVLAGREYLQAVRRVAPSALRPAQLECSRGIGDHLSLFARVARAASPWDELDRP